MTGSGKTLLVLGGGVMQVPALEIARERGHRVVVFDRSSQVPGARIADLFLAVDISDEEACLDAAEKLSLRDGLDGVMTLGTDFSTTVAKITGSLGLPGHTYQAALKAKDKYLMRQAFQAAGVPSPDFALITTEAEASGVKFPGPWVVKPADSMGARGVQLVKSREGLEPAVREALTHSRKKSAIVEEFIPGREFSLDALVYRGNIAIQGLADRDIWFPPRFIEMGHRFPTHLDSERKQRLVDTFQAGIRSLGLSHGAAKGDLRWHPEKGPMVGEIAARLSGGYMSGWTYPYTSGLSSVSQAVSLALGEEVALVGSLGEKPVAERAVISIPGRIKALEGWEDLTGVPGYKNRFLNRQPGDLVPFPRNNVEKVGNFILEADTVEELDRRVLEAYSRLLVRLEPQQPETTAWLEDSTGPASFTKEARTDYYGLTREDILRQFREVTGTDGEILGKKDGRFWTYMEKGGLQGLVYYWDSYCSPRGF